MKHRQKVIFLTVILLLNVTLLLIDILVIEHLYLNILIGIAFILPILLLFAKQYDMLLLYNKQIANLLTNVDAFVCSMDFKTGKIKFAIGLEKLYGYKKEDFEKDPALWKTIIHPDDVKKVEENEDKLFKNKSTTQVTHEHRIVKPSGEVVWLNSHLSTLLNSKNEVKRFNIFSYNITERKKAEDKVKQMAFHDSLTEIPNRVWFNRYLRKRISYCEQNQKNMAVLFVDIDRFKIVNDTFGHARGDDLLKAIAKRLSDSIESNGTVCRNSGDEFIILLEDVEKENTVEVSQKIIKQFSAPFYIKDRMTFVSPSIGISQYPLDGTEEDILVERADKAMYAVKQSGKNNYQFYSTLSKNKSSIFTDDISLEADLRKAMKNNELELYYQPLVQASSSEIVGAEALIRWNHPEYGLIPPFEFLPLAEETGLILPIGEWVLKQACLQNKEWQEEGFQAISVSVNISSLQLQSEDFVPVLQRVLKETQLEPEFLVLEIVENVIKNLENTTFKFQQLKSMGIRIAIDDFGTGYSSLSRLRYLPVDGLKIDKSFTSMIGTDGAELLKTMIKIGENLNTRVVVEGVENQEQANFLKESGCTLIQGFFYGRPLPAKSLENKLKKENLSM